MRNVRFLGVLLLACAWALQAKAQAPAAVPTRVQSVLACPLVATAPIIDGKLDDAVWAQAQPLREFSFKKAGVSYQTEAWICRDASNIYLAARCFDAAPDKVVSTNEALWRNDCIELYLVPDKKAAFYVHFAIDCAGKYNGETWVPDEWNEPTAGAKVNLQVKTGREAKAWTVEVAIPIASFGRQIKPDSVWALGLNREKWTEPVEVSSFQGGFNRPGEYPDLVFDTRSLVFDGIGVRNLSPAQAPIPAVNAIFQAGDKTEISKLNVPPGRSIALDWRKALGDLPAGKDFTLTLQTPDGKTLAQEKYTMVAPPKPLIELDVAKLPAPKFAPSVLDDPKFFPIGVWLQPAGGNVTADYKAMGVNVYFGGESSYPSPKGKTWLDALQKEGMYGIISYSPEAVAEKLHEHPAMIGWHIDDEPDQSKDGKPSVGYDQIAATLAKVRAASPARPLWMNLTCAVADERWIGRGLPEEMYPKYCALADVLSYDLYPCNSLGADGPERFHLVAKGMDRLRKWTDGRKPRWFVLEINRFTKAEEQDSRSPTPEEVQTQMWMALVHGARGLVFFCHSWYQKADFRRIEPDMVTALTKYDGEIQSLARVLNAPDVAGAKVVPSLGGRVDVLVKKVDGATYVMAVNMYRKAEKPAITLPGVADGTAEVLFEKRTVPVKGGQIVDDFAPYAVHRYKIAGP